MATQKFIYSGRVSGAPVDGEVEASDAANAALLLQTRGITPVRIAPAKGKDVDRTGAASDSLELFRPKVRLQDQMMFSRQMHTLLRSGVPILRALASLQDSSANATMKKTLADVRQSLESGIELSRCLAQHGAVFDGFYVSMVRVGEMTGRLDSVFMRLFEHLEFESFMQQQVKSALRYPSFVILAMVAAMGVMNVMVIPAFAQVFAQFNAELPWATRLLIGMSNFTTRHGWWLLLGSAVAFVALRLWISQPEGRQVWDRLMLRMPLGGPIVHKATLARFARSLALSLRSGVPIEQALQVVSQTVDNAHIAHKVDSMREAVARGDTILRAAMGTGVFTPVVLQMIAVGEETGAVDELMDEIAQLYNNEVQYELKTLSQQIEPILIVFLGVMVLVLALGVFLPMWDLGRVALKK